MHTVDDRIMRLEIRSDQLRIHLSSIDRNSGDAGRARAELLAMLKKMVLIKTLRQRRESVRALDGSQIAVRCSARRRQGAKRVAFFKAAQRADAPAD
jgi:hypothetical protein